MCLRSVLVWITLWGLAGSALGQGTIRSQAVVNLTFDEAGGPALDTATVGAASDSGTLEGGAVRIRSPFWGQAGKQAVVLDAGSQQRVQISDSPDVDRPDSVTFSLLYANLHPPGDGTFRGLIGKRDPAGTSNYGINFNNATFQVYINDGSGFRVAQFASRQAIPSRQPVFLTAVFHVGDAPSPDEDSDSDDVLVRLYVNGKPLTATNVVGGGVPQRDEAWLLNVKTATLVNDIPLTIGSSAPNLEPASAIIDEFSLFNRVLAPEEVEKLFREVIGPETSTDLPQPGRALQAGPQISQLSHHGVQIGHTTNLTISGDNFDHSPSVILPIPGLTQALVPVPGGGTADAPPPKQFTVALTLPADVPPGHYPLRVRTASGVSRAVPLAVDGLPHVPAGETTPQKPLSLPAAVSGTLTGGQQIRVHIAGTAGQRLVADVEARRIGANCSPVLELRNPQGAPIAIAWGRTQFRGDTRIETRLPTDGIYTLDLHDLSYNAPGVNPIRLKLGDLKLADMVVPSVIRYGEPRSLTLVGVGLDAALRAPVEPAAILPGLTRSVANLPVDAAAVPLIRAGDADDVAEAPPAEGLQRVDARFAASPHIPVVIAGQLLKDGEEDQYLVQVKPGMTLNFTVETQSIPSPASGQVDLHRAADGALLASSDDRGTLDFAVPADVSELKVVVRDLNGQGSPYHLYRLRMIPVGQPGFSLTLETNLAPIARGGAGVVRVDVNRQGYGGPIRLICDGPLRIEPQEIPAGANKVFVNFLAGADLADGLHVVHLRGESTGLTPPLVRVAQAASDPRMALVPNASADLAIVVGASAGVSLDLGTLPSTVYRGVDVSLPVKLTVQDPAAAKAVVRLTLLTTEAARPVDPNDPNKGQKPLVRSLPEQTLAAGEAEGSLRVAVPLDVAEPSLSCVLKAELVSHAFSDAVLARVYSRPFTLQVQPAAAVQLSANPIVLKAAAETKVAGVINRTAGYADPVTLVLVNLPAGYATAPVVVGGDQSAFELAVTAPAAAAADLPNILLRVTGLNGAAILPDVPVAVKVAP